MVVRRKIGGAIYIVQKVNLLKFKPWHPIAWSCGVVVITSALHAEGPQFDPGRDQMMFYYFQQRIVKMIAISN